MTLESKLEVWIENRRRYQLGTAVLEAALERIRRQKREIADLRERLHLAEDEITLLQEKVAA